MPINARHQAASACAKPDLQGIVFSRRMRKPSLPEKLAVALLSEIASGLYFEKNRFLSRREIMRQWKVSSPTASQSLALLVSWKILRVSDRSGHHFSRQFVQKALLRLNQTQLSPLPGQPSWDDKVRHLQRRDPTLRRIGVVSVCDGLDKILTRHYSAMPEISLTLPVSKPAKTIFNEANAEDVTVDFYLDDGKATTGEHIVRSLIKSDTQGVIILRRLMSSSLVPLAKPLIKAGIPVVAVFDDCEHLKMVSVNFNNVGIGYKAAQVFIAAGHRHIAVSEPVERETPNYYRDRFHGCQLAAAEYTRLHPEDKVTITGLSLPLSTIKPLNKAFRLFDKKNPRRATALLSTSVSLLQVLESTFKKGHIQIPGDLSVIMCSSTPSLPSNNRETDIMKLDFEAIGRQAYLALKSLFEKHFTEKTWLVDAKYRSHGTVRKRAS